LHYFVPGTLEVVVIDWDELEVDTFAARDLLADIANLDAAESVEAIRTRLNQIIDDNEDEGEDDDDEDERFALDEEEVEGDDEEEEDEDKGEDNNCCCPDCGDPDCAWDCLNEDGNEKDDKEDFDEEDELTLPD
jgi:hypothetical protein